jgi:hypothetical protein
VEGAADVASDASGGRQSGAKAHRSIRASAVVQLGGTALSTISKIVIDDKLSARLQADRFRAANATYEADRQAARDDLACARGDKDKLGRVSQAGKDVGDAIQGADELLRSRLPESMMGDFGRPDESKSTSILAPDGVLLA